MERESAYHFSASVQVLLYHKIHISKESLCHKILMPPYVTRNLLSLEKKQQYSEEMLLIQKDSSWTEASDDCFKHLLLLHICSTWRWTEHWNFKVSRSWASVIFFLVIYFLKSPTNSAITRQWSRTKLSLFAFWNLIHLSQRNVLCKKLFLVTL
jgi:hypothetical protein